MPLSVAPVEDQLWAVTVVLLVLAVLAYRFALCHAGVSAVSRARLRALGDEGNRRADALAALLAQRDVVQAALRVGYASCLVLAAASAWYLAALRATLDGAPHWTVALTVLLTLSIGAELFPRLVATARPEALVLRQSGWISLAYRTWGGLARQILGEPPVSRDDDDEGVEESIRELADTAPIDPDRRRRIAEILEFPDRTAGEVMVPRIDIVGVPADAALTEAAERMVESGYSRLPVYGASRDDIVGLVHARDILEHLTDAGSVGEVARQPLFVAESAELATLLTALRAHKCSVAIVIDEYGGTAGLVAVEDVVEEIVGEIHDETDSPPADIAARAEGGWLMAGRTELEELTACLGIESPAEADYNTAGGLVLALAGDLPEPDEVHLLVTPSARVLLMVLGVEGTRITEVAAVALPPDDGRGQDDAPPAEPRKALDVPGDLRLAALDAVLGYDEQPSPPGRVEELFALWPPGERTGRTVRWRSRVATLVAETDGEPMRVRFSTP